MNELDLKSLTKTEIEVLTFMQQKRKQYENPDEKLDFIFEVIRAEFKRSIKLHPKPYMSLHEGKAIMEEEFEENWDEIKKKQPNMDNIRLETIQIANTAVRFLFDRVF